MATAKLVLDARRTKGMTLTPIKISLCHAGLTRLISLKISVLPSQWDATLQQVINHPNKLQLNVLLNSRKLAVEKVILSLLDEGVLNSMSITELKTAVVDIAFQDREKPVEHKVKKEDPNTFEKWFIRFINKQKGRNKEIYTTSLKKLRKWLGEEELSKLRFEDIKLAWLEDLEQHLSAFNKPNTISLMMRNIKAVVNYAINNDVTTYYGFRKYKIPKEETRKRNFNIETLRRIFNAKVDPWQQRYLDFFKLSFMLIGINTIDLCLLKEIEEGRINYIRAKTHKAYSIKVEPEALEIIDRYRGEDYLLNFVETVGNYRHFNNRLYLGLNKIKDSLNEEMNQSLKNRTSLSKKKKEELKINELSMYWARHTWATLAAELDIPDAVIAQGLGHSYGYGMNSTTSIYIERNMKKVDEANRIILDWVFYDVTPERRVLSRRDNSKCL